MQNNESKDFSLRMAKASLAVIAAMRGQGNPAQAMTALNIFQDLILEYIKLHGISKDELQSICKCPACAARASGAPEPVIEVQASPENQIETLGNLLNNMIHGSLSTREESVAIIEGCDVLVIVRKAGPEDAKILEKIRSNISHLSNEESIKGVFTPGKITDDIH